jgi:hypothetical protein
MIIEIVVGKSHREQGHDQQVDDVLHLSTKKPVPWCKDTQPFYNMRKAEMTYR